MAAAARKPLAVTPAEARRLAAAVRGWEGAQPPRYPAGSGPVNWNPGVVRAVVTTAIPTGTFSSPSTAGRAQIYYKDPTGAWAASGAPVVVNNQHTLSSSIAVGKPVHMAWCDGDWFVITADCP